MGDFFNREPVPARNISPVEKMFRKGIVLLYGPTAAPHLGQNHARSLWGAEQRGQIILESFIPTATSSSSGQGFGGVFNHQILKRRNCPARISPQE